MPRRQSGDARRRIGPAWKTPESSSPASRTPAAAHPRRRMSSTAKTREALALPRRDAICRRASCVGTVATVSLRLVSGNPVCRVVAGAGGPGLVRRGAGRPPQRDGCHDACPYGRVASRIRPLGAGDYLAAYLVRGDRGWPLCQAPTVISGAGNGPEDRCFCCCLRCADARGYGRMGAYRERSDCLIAKVQVSEAGRNPVDSVMCSI